MTSKAVTVESKYNNLIQKFIEAKIENPRLSVRKFSKGEEIPHQSFSKILVKYPQIMEKILNGIRERYQSKSIEIDEALYQRALKGDSRAIELWYKRMERWNPHENEGEDTFTIVYFPGMLNEEELERFPGGKITIKRVHKREVINDSKEASVFDLLEEIQD
jgi:hypothetical protein